MQNQTFYLEAPRITDLSLKSHHHQQQQQQQQQQEEVEEQTQVTEQQQQQQQQHTLRSHHVVTSAPVMSYSHLRSQLKYSLSARSLPTPSSSSTNQYQCSNCERWFRTPRDQQYHFFCLSFDERVWYKQQSIKKRSQPAHFES